MKVLGGMTLLLKVQFWLVRFLLTHPALMWLVHMGIEHICPCAHPITSQNTGLDDPTSRSVF